MSYVCEACGHVDALCWKLPYSRGMEVSHCRLDELKIIQPLIAKKLLEAPLNEKNPCREVVIGYFAYGLWRREGFDEGSWYVRRRWIQIWKHQKWKAIPLEKAKKLEKKQFVTTKTTRSKERQKITYWMAKQNG